jgi:DNA-damage-inducible protein D
MNDNKTEKKEPMNSSEVAVKFFWSTQTEEKLCRENIQDKDIARQIHCEVGRKIRQTIEELGGTMPEIEIVSPSLP